MRWVYKTSVSHFKVKKNPLEHTDGKGKFKTMLSFPLVENGRLFFTKSSFEKYEIHEIFITADRSAWPVLKRNQAAKFLKNFQVHFVLYIDRFHCHATKKWIGNRPVEEAKKMKCYKRLILKQFVQVSGLCGPKFLSYLPKRFKHLCRALYGDAMLVHRFGAPIWPPENNENIWSSLFLKKALSFHSRTSIHADK